jgi:hypothetical protein
MPKSSSTPDQLAAARDQLLADYPTAVVELTLRLRDVIRSILPEARERVYLGWRGLGFHHPDAGYLCALFPGADQVRIGFERGHLLHDPDGLLEGDGHQVRYFSVRGWDDGLPEVLEALLHQATHIR